MLCASGLEPESRVSVTSKFPDVLQDATTCSPNLRGDLRQGRERATEDSCSNGSTQGDDQDQRIEDEPTSTEQRVDEDRIERCGQQRDQPEAEERQCNGINNRDGDRDQPSTCPGAQDTDRNPGKATGHRNTGARDRTREEAQLSSKLPSIS